MTFGKKLSTSSTGQADLVENRIAVQLGGGRINLGCALHKSVKAKGDGFRRKND